MSGIQETALFSGGVQRIALHILFAFFYFSFHISSKKKSRPNNTLRPQERMAFSVGEPVISASPPSCTKEKHRCNCVKHGRLVIAIDKCYG